MFQTSGESIVTECFYRHSLWSVLVLFQTLQKKTSGCFSLGVGSTHTHTANVDGGWKLVWFCCLFRTHYTIYLHIDGGVGENIKVVCVCLKVVAVRHTEGGEKKDIERERQRGAAVAGGKASTNLTVAQNALARRWLLVRVVRIWPQGGLKRFGLEFETALRNAAVRATSLCVAFPLKKRRNGSAKPSGWWKCGIETTYGERERREKKTTPATFPRPSLFPSSSSIFFFFSFFFFSGILFLLFGVWQQQVFPSISICSNHSLIFFFIISIFCTQIWSNKGRSLHLATDKKWLSVGMGLILL